MRKGRGCVSELPVCEVEAESIVATGFPDASCSVGLRQARESTASGRAVLEN